MDKESAREKPPVDPSQELMFEILRKIQADVAAIKTDLSGVKEQVYAIRGQINSLQSDVLRVERGQSDSQLRLDRIERRLELHDGPSLHT